MISITRSGGSVTVNTRYQVPALVDSVRFNPAAGAPTYAEGTVYWDATDHTLAVMPETSASTLQVGQENWVRIVNKTGSQLNDGQVVYLSGAQGNRPTAALAIATSTTADRVIGVCTANIANNAEGYVTTLGLVRGINTSGFSAGDTLYVSASTPGALTNVAPTAPNHSVRVGYALNSTGSGMLFVSPHSGSDLATLHDVLLTSPVDKHALRYDFANTRWTNTAHGAWLDTAQTWSAQQTFSQPILAANGTAAAPGISFSADPDCGLARIASNNTSISSGGSEVLRLAATAGTLSFNASVALGTAPITATAGLLKLFGVDGTQMGVRQFSYGNVCSAEFTRTNGTAAAPTKVVSGNVLFQETVNGYQETTGALVGSIVTRKVYAAEDFTSTANGTYQGFFTAAAGGTSDAERWRINPSGQLVAASNESYLTALATFNTNTTPHLQLLSGTGTQSFIGQGRWGGTGATIAPEHILSRSRGSTIGTFVATSSGDRLALWAGEGVGSDAAAFTRAAALLVEQDAAGGSAIVPGRLVFQTANSSGTLTEALRIDSAQQVQAKSTTASTSTTTGALVVSGGVGVAGAVYAGGAVLSTAATAGIGYATGSGGTVTQTTSRTTGVVINKVCGQITLVSAAGSTSWQSFTVTNSAVAATDTVRVCQASGTDLYMCHVTAVSAGSFRVTFATTGGTTTEQPVFNFAIIKAVAA